MNLPDAEDVNYWKTGSSSPDVWMEKSKREIETAGGTVVGEGFGAELQTGREAYMLAFQLGGDSFKICWPVLPSEDRRAARRQAATMLYHDTKARCVSAKVLGGRNAFFSFLMLPDGRTAGELVEPEAVLALPDMLSQQKAIT